MKHEILGYLFHRVPDLAYSCVQRLILHVQFRWFW